MHQNITVTDVRKFFKCKEIWKDWRLYRNVQIRRGIVEKFIFLK